MEIIMRRITITRIKTRIIKTRIKKNQKKKIIINNDESSNSTIRLTQSFILILIPRVISRQIT